MKIQFFFTSLLFTVVLVTQRLHGLTFIDAENFNQQQVADELSKISLNPSPEIQASLLQFMQLDVFRARETLSQMIGEPYTNVMMTAELANRQFIRKLFDPLRRLITENPCAPYVFCTYQPTFDIWAEISGGRSFIHGNRNARGFRISGYEFSLGAQIELNRSFTVGSAFSYQRDVIGYRVGGSGINEAVLGAVYSLYRSKRFYLLGDLVLGCNYNKMKRTIEVGAIRINPRNSLKIYQATGYAEIGTDFGFNFILVQPFFGLEMGGYYFGKSNESHGDGFALTVRSKSYTSAFTRLGVHLTSAPLLSGTSLGIDFSWNYRLTSLNNSIHQKFQQFGDIFTIKGLPLQRNSFEGAVILNQEIGKRWNLYLEAIGEGWNNSFVYSFIAGFQSSW